MSESGVREREGRGRGGEEREADRKWEGGKRSKRNGGISTVAKSDDVMNRRSSCEG